MLWANRQGWPERKLAVVHVALHVALLIFLVKAFYQFNNLLGRSVLRGCFRMRYQLFRRVVRI